MSVSGSLGIVAQDYTEYEMIIDPRIEIAAKALAWESLTENARKVFDNTMWENEFSEAERQAFRATSKAVLDAVHSWELSLIGLKPNRHSCRCNVCSFSKAMGQPLPRLCTVCGSPEC